MGKMGSFSVKGLKEFQRQLEKIRQNDVEAFMEACAKELAARLLAKVIKRTPVGDYSKEIIVKARRDTKHHKKGDTYTKRINPTGKKGGTLRRGWTSKTHAEAEAGKGASTAQEVKEFIDSLKVERVGNMLTVEIVNPVEYASYVEYGHRKVNGGWTRGHLMLKMSERELQTIAPKVLEGRLKKFLEECNDKVNN